MRHLRSICRSVVFRGGRSRHSVNRGRRDLGSCFKTGGCRRGSPCGRLGLLPFSYGSRRAAPVPFFSGRSRRASGGASFVHRCAGGFTPLLRRGYGTLGGDERNAGHGDPISVHHELGQGWSAAVSSQETIVDA
jgi:hypothetical protein